MQDTKKQTQNTYDENISNKLFNCVKIANEFKNSESDKTRTLRTKYGLGDQQ